MLIKISDLRRRTTQLSFDNNMPLIKKCNYMQSAQISGHYTMLIGIDTIYLWRISEWFSINPCR